MFLQSPDEPNNKVVVLVVNDCRDAPVWIDPEVFGSFVLPFREGQIHGLTSQPSSSRTMATFLVVRISGQEVSDPLRRTSYRTGIPAIRPKDVGVQGKLFSMRYLVVPCGLPCRN